MTSEPNVLIPDLQSIVDQFEQHSYVYSVYVQTYRHNVPVGIFDILSQAIRCALQHFMTQNFFTMNDKSDKLATRNHYDEQNNRWTFAQDTLFTDSIYRVNQLPQTIQCVRIDVYRLNPTILQDGEQTNFMLRNGYFEKDNQNDDVWYDGFDHIECYRAWCRQLESMMSNIPVHSCCKSGHLFRHDNLLCHRCRKLIGVRSPGSCSKYNGPSIIRFGLLVYHLKDVSDFICIREQTST